MINTRSISFIIFFGSIILPHSSYSMNPTTIPTTVYEVVNKIPDLMTLS